MRQDRISEMEGEKGIWRKENTEGEIEDMKNIVKKKKGKREKRKMLEWILYRRKEESKKTEGANKTEQKGMREERTREKIKSENKVT